MYFQGPSQRSQRIPVVQTLAPIVLDNHLTLGEPCSSGESSWVSQVGQDKIFVFVSLCGAEGDRVSSSSLLLWDRTCSSSVSIIKVGWKASGTCLQCPRQEATWFQASQVALSLSVDHFLHITQIRAAS